MRLSKGPLSLLLAVMALIPPASAEEHLLRSNSLNSCQENSGFSASLFNVVFTPNNNSVFVNMAAVSSIEGSVIFDISITAYGYEITHRIIDPCVSGLAGFCPMVTGKPSIPFSLTVSPDAVRQIPGIAYTFPDLDAKVRVYINRTDGANPGESVACLEANVSNGKTVDLLGIKWAAALVTGLTLVSSAVLSALGHTNAASHVASNALSLCGYFQAQAMVGLVGIPLPPVVQSWTQDFQWSMGIINVGFLQTIFTWYQRATGGTPSQLFDSLGQVSVSVQKRSLSAVRPAVNLFRRALAIVPPEVTGGVSGLARRANIQLNSGAYLVRGIQRVAYRAHIESTNLFMTAIVFYLIFMVLGALFVAGCKGLCELLVKERWMKGERLQDFRNGWRVVLKGVLYRITLIGFPPVVIFSLWEFTQKDSAAEIVWAVFMFFGVTITLGWAAFKVIRIARRSVALHKNPAYALFSDQRTLDKWGFLYIQFRASAYYFIVPVLLYTMVKGMFIAFGQGAGIVQAIALVIIEAAALITASVCRPWMDRKTNTFNIAICVVNFCNSIFLLIFTEVFDQPALGTSVVGVILWILNAAFTLVYLLLLIITTSLILINGNPDSRYQFMADDRTSFMKSQSKLSTTAELNALSAAARGSDRLDLDEEPKPSVSSSSDSHRRRTTPTDS